MNNIIRTREQYNKLFNDVDNTKEKTLEQALDIRKFEIELYWKRAIYFWTFIALFFAGYFSLDITKYTQQDYYLIKLILSCVGFVFSIAWYLVNKGSKYWQANWEVHIDLLEDKTIGPLFKTILHEDMLKKDGLKSLISPSRYSVSNINQALSLFISIIWAILTLMSVSAIFEFHNCFLSFISITLYPKIIAVIILLFSLIFIICLTNLKGKRFDEKEVNKIDFREIKQQKPK